MFNNKDFGLLDSNKYIFVCGTNLLKGMKLKARRNQWKIGIKFLSYILKKKINNIVLVGVGWNSYQNKKLNFLEKYFLKKLLNNGHLHSVRDEYTRKKLQEIGIKNVINTGCLTTWSLTQEHCRKINTYKSDKVIFTLTDYNRDYNKDRKLIEILKRNYKEVYFWPQGSEDLEYVKELVKDNILYEIISPNYESYKNFLEENECDFIGTRLHGGIKALQLLKRTIIIGIDNRALEMQGNNLPILKRDEIDDKLDEMINSNFIIKIDSYSKNIEKWKSQFYIND